MDQVLNLADIRLIHGCVYCGAPAETRDHVPSRILLEPPYPENLPVVEACWSCNNGFSKDEEYFVCLVECAIAGSTDPEKIRRSTVAKALKRSASLRARIEAAKRVTNEGTEFGVEPERIKNVLLKLARGHAAFEISKSCRREPDIVWCRPLALLNENDRDSFNAAHVVRMLGEIGSRASQRILVTEVSLISANGEKSVQRLLVQDWVDVQDGFYRYMAIDDADLITIRMVIAEYLACEVIWKNKQEPE